MEPKTLSFLVVVPGSHGDEDVFVAESSAPVGDSWVSPAWHDSMKNRIAETAATRRLQPGPWVYEWTAGNGDGLFRRLDANEAITWAQHGTIFNAPRA